MKNKSVITLRDIPCGFEYGSAKVTRLLANQEKGFVIVAVETPKYGPGNFMQIYVTKTGKVRVFDKGGEWTPPTDEESNYEEYK